MDPGDLGDAQLRQLMEDLCQEVALMELDAPPGTHCQAAGGLQQEVWTLMCMTRRSPFQEGGDGNPEDNHLGLLPPQLDEDVGHLINTPATILHLGTQHINTFSGKAMLGNMEMSFEQWYHKVCVKDHYLESVVWESIVTLLKGTAADMAQYVGPTTSMAHILQTLTVIFSTVVSFDVLMQNSYKVTQGNHEKVPPFATRLEGTLNQIRLQCPGRITD